MKKKAINILMVFIILFTTLYVQPSSRVQAAAFVVPAGYSVGAGGYALGALLVGTGASYLGIEYGEEIQDHAHRVWDTASQQVKDSWDWSVQQSIAAGSRAVNLTNDVYNWLKSGVVTATATVSSATWMKAKPLLSKTSGGVSYPTKYPEVAIYFPPSSSSTTTVTIPAEAGYYFVKSDALGQYVGRRINITLDSADLDSKNAALSFGTTSRLNRSIRGLDTTIFHDARRNGKTLEEIMLGLASVGINDIYLADHDVLQNVINTRYTITNELVENALTRARDVGLYLPTTSITAYPREMPTQELLWNPDVIDGGAWTFPNTGSVYQGEVGWAFPVPRVIDHPTTGVATTVVDVPAGAVDIHTGTIVQAPTADPPITGDPPVSNPPESKPGDIKNRFGQLVSTKFPFSLPWDMYAIVTILAAKPIRPDIDIKTNLSLSAIGTSIPIDIKHDFNYLDPYIAFFRTFILIGFVIFLILSTRNLLGGAK